MDQIFGYTLGFIFSAIIVIALIGGFYTIYWLASTYWKIIDRENKEKRRNPD